MKKKEKTCLKIIILKLRCNPNNPEFDLFKFLGEINLHISTLPEDNTVNGLINKVT